LSAVKALFNQVRYRRVIVSGDFGRMLELITGYFRLLSSHLCGGTWMYPGHTQPPPSNG